MHSIRIYTFSLCLQDGKGVDDNDDNWNSCDEIDSDSEEDGEFEDEKKNRLSQASIVHPVAAVCYFHLCCTRVCMLVYLDNQSLDSSFRTHAREECLDCKRLGQRKYLNV